MILRNHPEISTGCVFGRTCGKPLSAKLAPALTVHGVNPFGD